MMHRTTATVVALLAGAAVLAAPTVAGASPTIEEGSGGLLSRNWIRGNQTAVWSAYAPGGVYYAEMVLGGTTRVVRATNSGYCPMDNLVGYLTDPPIYTGAFADGIYTMYLSAVGCDGGPPTEHPVPVYIDNHAPDQPQNVSVAGGEGWHASNDFSLSWSNPEEKWAPIAAANYKLCLPGQDPANCPSSRTTGSNLRAINAIKLPGEGDYTARLYLEDAAGNANDGSYVPVHLRYDATPPSSVTFRPQDTSDPRRVEVAVSDAVSGLGSGQIEMRKFGTSAWLPVPGTRAEGQKLVAQINDRALSKGQYELRTAARDQAGNERGSSQLADGSSAGFTMPLRAPVEVQAGFPKNVRARGSRKKSGPKTVHKLISVRRVGYGRAATIVGYVRDASNRVALGGAEVNVLARSRLVGADFRQEGTVQADGNGRFKYRAPAGVSRLLSFDYLGTATIGGAADSVRLRVPGASSFRASKRHARDGETVRFSGRLRGKPYPAGGKIVALQVYTRSRWRTFKNTTTRATGTWATAYQFDGSPPGSTRYRFRARIPREPGVYPYELGNTRTRDVIVRG